MNKNILLWMIVSFVLVSSVSAIPYVNMSFNNATQINPGVYTTTSAEDLAGNHDGAVTEAIQSNISGINLTGAYSFDGVNDNIALSEVVNSSYLCYNGCTLCAWVNPKPMDEGVVIGKYDSTSNARYLRLAVGRDENYFPYFTFGVPNALGTAGIARHAIGATNLTLNQWSHICGRFNGTPTQQGNLTVYYNGVLDRIHEDIYNFTWPIPFAEDEPIYIGQTDDSSPQLFFNGTIDEVAIFNYSLLDSEITDLFNSYSPAPPPPIYTPPTLDFYNQTPLNGSHISVSETLNFDLSNFNLTVNCTLYVNGTQKYSDATLVNGSRSFTYYTTYGNEGFNELNITCIESANTSVVRSEIKYIYQDSLSPYFSLIQYNQSGLANLDKATITADFSYHINMSDNYLYYFNVNVTGWNRAGNNYSDNVNVTGLTSYLYANATTAATYTPGWTHFLFNVLDAHTLNDLNAHQNKQLETEPLLFIDFLTEVEYKGKKIGKTVKLYGESSKIKDIKITKETKYSRNFKIDLKNAASEFETTIEADTITPINSEYPGHFVLNNLVWIDYLPKDSNTEIKEIRRINKKKYKIKIGTKDGTLKTSYGFNSFGIINSNITNATAYIDNFNRTNKVLIQTFYDGANSTYLSFNSRPSTAFIYIDIPREANLSEAYFSFNNSNDYNTDLNLTLDLVQLYYVNRFEGFYTTDDLADTITPHLAACSCSGCSVVGTSCRLAFLFNQSTDIFGDSNGVTVDHLFISHSFNWNWSYTESSEPSLVAQNDSTVLMLNITYNSTHISELNATLNDSGRSYIPTKTVYADYIEFTYQAPANRSQATYTYNWFVNYTQSYDSQNKQFTTTGATYEIYTWNLSTCSGPDTSIIFTIWDENYPGVRLNSTLELEVDYWITDPTKSQTYNVEFEGNHTYRLCFSPFNQTYYSNLYTQYTTVGGFTHRYYLINQTFNNISIVNATIYNFNETTDLSNLEMVARYKINYTYYPNVLAKLQRLYLSEGVYRTVQMDKSGDFGNIFFNIKEENTDYRISFYDEANNLLKQTAPMKFVCTSGVCELVQLLTEYEGNATTTDLSVVYHLDNVTRMIQVNWSDSLGNNNAVQIRVIKETLTGTATICDVFQTGASGTYNCNASAYTGDVLLTVLTSNSPYTPIKSAWIRLTSGALSGLIPKAEAALWTAGIIITVVGFGLFSPAAAVVSTIIGLIFVFFLGIFGPLSVTFIIIAAALGIAIGLKVKA